MKDQIKGKGRFKGLLLAHGEKLGMVLVVLCVVWLVYSGMGQEQLEPSKQPGQLKQRAESASQNITKTTYEQLPDDRKLAPVDYGPAAVMEQIELPKYSIEWPLNPPEFPRKTKREDPKFLPVEELQVHGGVGLLATIDPSGGVGRRSPGRGEGVEGVRRPMPGAGGISKPPSRRPSRTQGNPRRGTGRGGDAGYGVGTRGSGRSRSGYGEDDGYSRGGPMGEGIAGPGRSLTEILPQGGVRVGPSDTVKARYWSVVLAKVPLTKQLELYRRAFRDAEGYEPQYDVPGYYGYIVQRAEITGDGEPPQWKNLKPVTETTLMKLTQDWSSEAPPLIDPRYADPLLTFPLPPLVGHDWDPAMIKLSDVPLASLGGRFGQGDLGQPDDATGADGKSEIDEHGFEQGPQGQLDGTGPRGRVGGRGGYGGRSGYGDEGGIRRGGIAPPGGSRRGGGIGPPSGGRRGGYGRGEGGYGSDGYSEDRMSRGSPMMRGRPGAPSRSRMPQRRGGYGEGGYGGGYGMQQEEIPFALFRFFDFSVTPGHRYQYRVQLALYDPNDQIEPKYLSGDVITRREGQKNSKYVLTDWSAPSPVVMVPFPGQVLAGPVKYVRPDQYTNEPTAKVLATMLDDKESVEGVAELERVRRGKVANFTQSTEVIDYGEMRPSLRKIDNFSFLTNTMLVDVRGGAPVSKKNRELTEPGELLLLDPAGRLVVRTELADGERYEQLRALLDAAEEQNDRRGRAGPGGGRYDGGYGEDGPQRGGGYGEEGLRPQDRGGRSRGRPRGQSSRGRGRGD